uniref:NADH-ubiquinone oxidoreductase chain 1 n=1 Tax=Ophiomusa kimblae TaxID=3135533 RepID=A0AAU6PX18_9ECHI
MSIIEEFGLYLNLVCFLVPVLVAVALLTLLERKVLGYMQYRKGPNVVGPYGLLQPLADALKLFIKESVVPVKSSSFLFLSAPPLFLFFSLCLWGALPVNVSALNLNLSLLFIIAISSLSVYSILGAGWASNSKYALLGATRAVAQVISYEVCFVLILLPMLVLSGGWDLYLFQEVLLIFPCFPLFLMWVVSGLAETNRTPFDLAEGESELVSGYNVEYAGGPFALFFIGEYANIIVINVLTVVLFFGFVVGLSMVSGILFFVFLFLWLRATFPRVRYDQLMNLMWKGFLPLTMALLVYYSIVVFVVSGFSVFY